MQPDGADGELYPMQQPLQLELADRFERICGAFELEQQRLFHECDGHLTGLQTMYDEALETLIEKQHREMNAVWLRHEEILRDEAVRSNQAIQRVLLQEVTDVDEKHQHDRLVLQMAHKERERALQNRLRVRMAEARHSYQKQLLSSPGLVSCMMLDAKSFAKMRQDARARLHLKWLTEQKENVALAIKSGRDDEEEEEEETVGRGGVRAEAVAEDMDGSSEWQDYRNQVDDSDEACDGKRDASDTTYGFETDWGNEFENTPDSEIELKDETDAESTNQTGIDAEVETSVATENDPTPPTKTWVTVSEDEQIELIRLERESLTQRGIQLQLELARSTLTTEGWDDLFAQFNGGTGETRWHCGMEWKNANCKELMLNDPNWKRTAWLAGLQMNMGSHRVNPIPPWRSRAERDQDDDDALADFATKIPSMFFYNSNVLTVMQRAHRQWECMLRMPVYQPMRSVHDYQPMLATLPGSHVQSPLGMPIQPAYMMPHTFPMPATQFIQPARAVYPRIDYNDGRYIRPTENRPARYIYHRPTTLQTQDIRNERPSGPFNRDHQSFQNRFSRQIGPPRFIRQMSPTRDMRFPRQMSPTRDNRFPRQISPTHDNRFPRQMSPTRDNRFPRQISPTRDNQFSRKISPIRDERFTRQMRPTRDTWFPRKTNYTRTNQFNRQTSPIHKSQLARKISPTRKSRSTRKSSSTRENRFSPLRSSSSNDHTPRLPSPARAVRPVSPTRRNYCTRRWHPTQHGRIPGNGNSKRQNQPTC